MTFHAMRPTNELVQALNYWEYYQDDAFMRRFAAMQVWLNDPTRFPGEAFRNYITHLYQHNLLINGQFRVDGELVDLGRITAPTLTIAARDDRIAPWESVAVFNDLIGSDDKALIVLESGHIGLVIGSDAHRKPWPRLGAWLVARSGDTVLESQMPA
jgi:polyhydroxyalkanoate synthase